MDKTATDLDCIMSLTQTSVVSKHNPNQQTQIKQWLSGKPRKEMTMFTVSRATID
jgi:hypothetical protein